MAATSVTAIEWAAANGFSILMDPHSSRTDLARKRRHYAEKLAAAGYSESGRTIPMARLIAIDETAEKAREVARRAAQWTVASYVGPGHGAHRQEVRTFNGKDPIVFYLEDVMLHGTPEAVADQIHALESDAGMTYLMAAPMSRRSFTLLTDKVLPRIAG
jgi:alkanesulfonate monooxygenase SsuD/methylene tetrahydromethanopterin reductase-like flavin-dependent oxidoreductase (luciferase family)